MKDFARFLLESLAEHPKDVRVTSVEEGNIIKLKAEVAPSDRGKIIGKEGKIIKSVRTVLSAAALKKNIKVYLEID